MPRSNLVNAVDVALAADVAGADPTIQVTDPALLPAVPFYLVIDPFNDVGREYLRATSLAVDVLSVERDLDGSQSTTHAAGDIVRISYVAQHLSDLWAGIEGIPPQTYLHADLTDVTADQHHVKYTDAEAVAAVGTPWTAYLPLAGGDVTGWLSVGTLLTAGYLQPTLGANVDDLLASLDVRLPDGNDTRMVTQTRRFIAGADHSSAQLLISRKVDATWMGGLSLTATGVTLYHQATTASPYEPSNYFELTGAAATTVGDLNLFGSGQMSVCMRLSGTGVGHALTQKEDGSFILYDYGAGREVWQQLGGMVGMHMLDQNPDSAVARNITVSVVGPAGGIDGDVWITWA